MVALKRLADAERDGDRIYAVIRGVGSLVRRARARASTRRCPRARRRRCAGPTSTAGYGPDTVELVEAHGTGTKAGDAAEFEGLRHGVRRGGARATASGARSAR